MKEEGGGDGHDGDQVEPDTLTQQAAQASSAPGQMSKDELIKVLRKMQAKESHCDVAYDVLQDLTIRKLSWMCLACKLNVCFVFRFDLSAARLGVVSSSSICATSNLRIWHSRDRLRKDHCGFMLATKTRAGNIQLQAAWSSRDWAATIGGILSELSNPKAMYNLRLDQRSSDPDQQLQDATLFGKLILKQASHRTWSMSIHSELPPENWAALLHENPEKAKKGLAMIQNDCHTVEAAWSLQDNEDEDYEAELFELRTLFSAYELTVI